MGAHYNILEDSTYKHYKALMSSYATEIRTLRSIRDSLSFEMGGKLSFLEGSNPPLPDGHLVAYENAMEDALAFIEQDIQAVLKKHDGVEKDFYEWRKMVLHDLDSSEEIEQKQEEAKANNRRSKRSRFRPDSGTNYALEA